MIVCVCVYVCVVEQDAKKGGEARGMVRHYGETRGVVRQYSQGDVEQVDFCLNTHPLPSKSETIEAKGTWDRLIFVLGGGLRADRASTRSFYSPPALKVGHNSDEGDVGQIGTVEATCHELGAACRKVAHHVRLLLSPHTLTHLGGLVA